MKAIVLRDIKRPQFSSIFYQKCSRIVYDAKSPRARKQHALLYQQGSRYGEVGDMCDYLTHDELLDLERQGFVRLFRSPQI